MLLKPYCPPYYSDMKKAVRALIDAKFASGSGCFRNGRLNTAWRDPQTIQAGIPEHSATAIEETIAYCDYVYGRYGRFPSTYGPFRTIVAYQAHHIDPAFYRRFYRTEEAGCS